MSQTTPGSDPIYRRLYAFREMVADLLRSVLPASLLARLDLRSLDKLPADYVGDDFRRREGDAVWQVRLRTRGERGAWLYVLVLLEFQSSSDSTMALRILEYTAMLYRELLRRGVATAGRLPPVLPVVLYNGRWRWRAAQQMRELIVATGPELAQYQPSQRHAVLDERHVAADHLRQLTRAVALLEQSGSAEDLSRLANEFAAEFGPNVPRELKRAFADWLWVLGERLGPSDEAPPPDLTLEEVKMTLAERVSQWREPWIREGLKQGIERGIRRGLERQRAMLQRQAEARFGTQTAERLSALLQQDGGPQRLDALADAMVRCTTGEELLRQAAAAEPNDRHA